MIARVGVRMAFWRSLWHRGRGHRVSRIESSVNAWWACSCGAEWVL